MNPFMNEDMAWQRLQDLQREAENRRLVGGEPYWTIATLRRLGSRVWLLAGLAATRPPRRRPASPRHDSA